MGWQSRDSESPGALKVRLYRERKRAGMRVLQNPVVSGLVIDAFIRTGLLQENQRDDPKATAEAASLALEMWSTGVAPDDNDETGDP